MLWLEFLFYYDEIGSFISDNFESDDKIFLLGNFNIDIASTSNIGRYLIELFMCRVFKPLITQPAKLENKMIDHIWFNYPYNYNSAVILNEIRDHYVIFTSFKLLNFLLLSYF